MTLLRTMDERPPGSVGLALLWRAGLDASSAKFPSMLQAAAYRTWRRTPVGLRSTVRRTLGRTAVEDVVADEVRAQQAAAGFMTMSPDSLAGLLKCLRVVKDSRVVGDYFEFGMFRGYTFWFSQRAADELGLAEMRFWGYDSFAGLPEVVGIDSSSGEFSEGDYACSLDIVTANLDRWGFDGRRGALVPGYFDQLSATAAELAPTAGKVALAMIDCDLYSSTVPVLDYLAERLQDGSVLLFDDWNCYSGDDEMGERRAFREFMADHPGWEVEDLFDVGWHGHAVRLRRRF